VSQGPAPAPAPAPQEQSAPVLYLDGQPVSAEAAGATRAALLGNPTYAKQALTDPAKQKHLAILWQLERGIQPAAPTTEAEVQQHTADRVERERLTHVSALRSAADGITEEQLRQIVGGRPIPAEEKQIAQRRLAALQRDKGFVDRYLAGDQEARLQMSLAAIAARGMPVGTLEQIKAWEAAHPSPVRK
jgi:hypothetical protein